MDRESVIQRLKNLSTEKLSEILRERNTSEWREEIFTIVERMLAERLGKHGRAVVVGTPAAQKTSAAAAEPTHTGTTIFNEARADAIAVHCSDGRLAQHFDEFLTKTLGISRCDRLAVPGGPVFLAGRLAAFWEGSGVENQARFLVETHQLKRVILIAHEGCGYYVHKLGLALANIEAAQREDLTKAAHNLTRLGEHLEITAFLARRQGDRILFESVPI